MFGPVQIGGGVIIEDDVVLGHPSVGEIVAITDRSQFGNIDEFYRAAARAPTVVGDNVTIRSGSVIYSGCLLGDGFDCGHNVLLRENVRIGPNTYVKSYTEIMKNTVVGSHCRLAGTICDNSVLEDYVSSFGILTHRYDRYYTLGMSQQKGPLLRKGCIVGRGAVVLGSVEIGPGAIVGANAFVNFDVPANVRVLGLKGQQK